MTEWVSMRITILGVTCGLDPRVQLATFNM
jgi:hypothetical protein